MIKEVIFVAKPGLVKNQKKKDKRRHRVLEIVVNKNKAKGSAYEQRIANRLTNEFKKFRRVPLSRIN